MGNSFRCRHCGAIVDKDELLNETKQTFEFMCSYCMGTTIIVKEEK